MGNANVKNIRSFSGWFYAKILEPTASATERFIKLGHIESVNVTYDMAREKVYASGDGTREQLDTMVNERTGTLNAVLRETTALNLALATASNPGEFYSQAAANAVILTGTNARAGDAIRLGYQGVVDVTVTDGTNELVAGTHYTLDAPAGIIEFTSDQAEYDITFDAPAVLESARKPILRMLSAEEGIKLEFLIVQKQRRGGTRKIFRSAHGIVFPSGDLTLIKEDQAPVTVSITAELVPNPTVPYDERFGVMEEVAALP